MKLKTFKYKIIDNQAQGGYGYSWEVYATNDQGESELIEATGATGSINLAKSYAKETIKLYMQDYDYEQVTIKY